MKIRCAADFLLLPLRQAAEVRSLGTAGKVTIIMLGELGEECAASGAPSSGEK
ncbi:hypothetical protein [Numidum massiliense]|uniref:hypothetical protein n=1 Tax=Numidum massiliense TaxID=1522315 RepID=UPI0012FCD30D|nr:hypothetical protein [Numidum massiliense]